MFTGIILDVGRISEIRRQAEDAYMVFSTRLDTSAWTLGDSIAVDGCCLTITDFPVSGQFEAVLSLETLECTHFGDAGTGQPVNLEPALRAGDALGGHMVSGHVDGIGKVLSVEPVGEHCCMRISIPPELCRYAVVKGSMTINGVSLTVNEVDDESFTVNLIPHTLSHTNLGALQQGHQVNLETDIIGRYVERLLACREPRVC